MAITNTYQAKTQVIQYGTLFDKVSYQRVLMALGSTPADWQSAPFENAQRDILRLSYSEIQSQNNTLADNVFRTIGVDYQSEHILITPVVLEIAESQFRGSNVNDVIPMVITEMNQELDIIANRNLLEISKKGPSYTWCCQEDFLDFAISIARIPYGSQLRKYLIIPEQIFWCMLSGTRDPNHPSWYSALGARMAEMHTSVIVSPFSNRVFLIQELFLNEYPGMEPHVYKSGHDDRKNEYWVHFLMSNTDFKPKKKDAVQSFEISNLPKLGSKQEFPCHLHGLDASKGS